MSDNIPFSIAVILSLLIGYLIGYMGQSSVQKPLKNDEPRVEISIIQFQKILGDSLHIDVSGPARILWSEKHMVENDGTYQIPLGQIPNENDLELLSFPYVGNAKTMKFYPSDSYPARGTAVKDRRFFKSKEAAITEGFIPMKNMK